MFNIIKKHFSAIYEKCSHRLSTLFNRKTIDEALLTDLNRLLLEADTGTTVTNKILTEVRASMHRGSLLDGLQLQQFIAGRLIELFPATEFHDESSLVFLIGVNGAGKTTCVSKLTYWYQQRGKKVLVCAADTYRAAAQEQIKTWCDRMNIDCVEGKSGEDPAAVVFKACKQFSQGNYDILLVDTSGRLPNAAHLMKLLAKMIKVGQQQLPNVPIKTLLILDALIGQNSLYQAQQFAQITSIHGVILTKMDSTSKGGIVFSLAYSLKLPIFFTTHGEHKEDFSLFNPHEYVNGLLTL